MRWRRIEIQNRDEGIKVEDKILINYLGLVWLVHSIGRGWAGLFYVYGRKG